MTDTIYETALPQPSWATNVTDQRMVLSNMIGDLDRLRGFAQKLELDEVVAQADQQLDRVKNKFFNVAVVGEFNRGKSTLINALLRKEVLPADVLPCSATLNRVTYGLTPSVKLVFKAKEDQAERVEDIPIEELKDYVTKLTAESETRAADIKEAVVYYPTNYCRDKADIIDTPGLNDDQHMTEVTNSVLPYVDAVIMVILAQAPFAGTEGDFLTNRILTNDIGRVLFVVNRIDEIRKPEDRKRILKTIGERILKTVEARAAELYDNPEEYKMFVKRIGKPKVFGVSSADALEARLHGDDELLAKSEFPKFEAALERFLAQKDVVSLQVLANCTVGATAKIQHQITIRENALQMDAQKFEELYQTAHAQLQSSQEQYQKETAAIDQAAQRALVNARLHLDKLPDQVREAVIQAINNAQVTPADLDKKQQVVEKLGKQVESGIRHAIQLAAEKMQLEIERELNREIGRLSEFAGEVNAVLGQIELEFTRLQANEKRGTTVDGVLAAVPIVGGLFVSNLAFGLGGAWAGYREAGVKGAMVGGTAGMATGLAGFLGTAVAVSALALPVTWPVLLVVGLTTGISSILGGRIATRVVFAEKRVERFKETYQTTVLNQIEEQLKGQKVDFDRRLSQQVAETFAALQRHTQQELGAPIEQTKKTLADLRTKLARSQAEREIELKELAEMSLETHNIQSKALAKSNELREIKEWEEIEEDKS